MGNSPQTKCAPFGHCGSLHELSCESAKTHNAVSRFPGKRLTEEDAEYLVHKDVEDTQDLGGFGSSGKLRMLWDQASNRHDEVSVGDVQIVSAVAGALPSEIKGGGEFDSLGEWIRCALSENRDLNASVHDGLNALLLSTLNGRLDLSRILVQGKADLEARDPLGRTALSLASEAGHVSVVMHLLASRSNPDATSSAGKRNALHAASEAGHCDIAKVLLRHGCGVMTRTTSGSTPLHIAVRANRTDMCELLIDANANVEAREGPWDSTVLASSARYGSLECAVLMMSARADVHSVDKLGRTPLMIASVGQHIGILTALLHGRASLDMKDYNELTAAAHARKKENADIVRILGEGCSNEDIEVTPVEAVPAGLIVSVTGCCSAANVLDHGPANYHGAFSVAKHNPRVILPTHENFTRD